MESTQAAPAQAQYAAPAAPPATYAAQPAAQAVATYADGKPMFDAHGRPVSHLSRLVAFLLALFVGVFGVHRFYAGKIGTGILMLLTLGGLGFWTLIDWIMITAGAFRDKDGRIIANW